MEFSLSEAQNNMKKLQSQLNTEEIDLHSRSLFSELFEYDSELIANNSMKQLLV
jgi:hypothetical protein